MAEPIIQTTQTGPGTGTAGEGNNNYVTGVAIHFAETEAANAGATYELELLSKPYDSAASLTSSLLTATLTPDVPGSYEILFTATLDGIPYPVIEIYRVKMSFSSFASPAWNEETQFDRAGNTKGWGPEREQFDRWINDTFEDHDGRIDDIETVLGSGVVHSDDDFGGDVSGTFDDISVDAVKGHTVGSLTNSQVLALDGSGNIVSLSRAGVDTAALPAATAFSGDVSGVYSSTSVDKVKGKTVGTLTDTQVLKVNGANIDTISRAKIDTSAVWTDTAHAGDVSGAYNVLSVDKVKGKTVGTLTDTELLQVSGSTIVTVAASALGALGLMGLYKRGGADESGLAANSRLTSFDTVVNALAGVTLSSSVFTFAIGTGKYIVMMLGRYTFSGAGNTATFVWYDTGATATHVNNINGGASASSTVCVNGNLPVTLIDTTAAAFSVEPRISAISGGTITATASMAKCLIMRVI